jgi:hypothetical protein
MLGDTIDNLRDTIAHQWLWLGAAGVLVALVVLFVGYSFLRKSRPSDAMPGDEHGWSPTGRIDFSDPQANGFFLLQAEDTRLVHSIAGVERRESRWRKATLDEAKAVAAAYHAHHSLTLTENYIAAIRRTSDRQNMDQDARLPEDEAVGNAQG